MSIKKIKQYNKSQFLEDIKSVRDALILPQHTDEYMRVTKKEVLAAACKSKINYYLSDNVFVVKRTVMVII